MMRKKLLSTIMALTMVTGICTPAVYAKPLNDCKGQNICDKYVSADIQSIIKALKQEGKISENASAEEIDDAVQNYLRKVAKKECDFSKRQAIRNDEVMQILEDQGIKLRLDKSNNYAQSEGKWNGTVSEDKILVILMEFDDFKHNKLTEEDTVRYVPDFSTDYYRNMLFKDKSYIGPKGKEDITFREYYEQQTGGSYTIKGDVYGWFKAKNGAAYYGKDENGSHNIHADELVREAVQALVANTDIDLSQYDNYDRKTGKYQPDGYIDRLMIVHAGIGQEANGGKLGNDAIWSHSSKVQDLTIKDKHGNERKVSEYTMEAEDTPVGVFAHEFAHDLGVPDEYDRNYSGKGDPVEGWSLMSAGSWFGTIGGTEPVGLSPWCKQIFQASMPQMNWLKGSKVDINDIPAGGLDFTLDQASVKGDNDSAVRINLPKKKHVIKEVDGQCYESSKINNNEAYMTLKNPIDVTTNSGITLKMKIDYDVENGWDYFYVQGKLKGSQNWMNLKDNEGKSTNATTEGGAKLNRGNGFTGSSKGWTNLSFDLAQLTTGSAIKVNNTSGSAIELRVNYATDPAALGEGIFIDDIEVTDSNNTVIFNDKVDSSPKFDLNGFVISNGITFSNNYYLVELRSHEGADNGLKHYIGIEEEGAPQYDPGIIVWYCDDFYNSNDDVGEKLHPGLYRNGVIDAGQFPIIAVDNPQTQNRVGKFGASVQLGDAAFSIRKGHDSVLNLGDYYLMDVDTFMNPIFDDSRDYSSKLGHTSAGSILPNNGLKIYVTSEEKDKSKATIHIAR